MCLWCGKGVGVDLSQIQSSEQGTTLWLEHIAHGTEPLPPGHTQVALALILLP